MSRRNALQPRKSPTQARSKATVEAILAAAAQVFERRGYAGATTDRIAERAGVSVGSLYQYFPNKDAVLVALAERHVDGGFSLVRNLLAEALSDQPPIDVLVRRFVTAMMALHEREPALHRVLFEEAPLPATLRRRLRTRENELASEVCTLLETHPNVRSLDAEVTAYVLVHTIDALVHNFVLHPPKDIDSESLTEEIVDLFHGHLAKAT